MPLNSDGLLAKPFCVGRMSGEPIDDVLEAGCERGLSLWSVLRGSRGPLTVAMFLCDGSRGGLGRRECAEDKVESVGRLSSAGNSPVRDGKGVLLNVDYESQ